MGKLEQTRGEELLPILRKCWNVAQFLVLFMRRMCGQSILTAAVYNIKGFILSFSPPHVLKVCISK